MPTRSLIIFAACFGTPALSFAMGSAPHPIKTAVEVESLSDPRQLEASKAVAGMGLKNNTFQVDAGDTGIFAGTLQELAGISPSLQKCENSPLKNQYSEVNCTGTLVGPDLILTAAHCLKAIPCDNAFFVFGFEATEADPDGSIQFPVGQVYSCKRVENTELHGLAIGEAVLGPAGDDYAFVRLDRPVTDRKPLALADTRNLKNGAPLEIYGYPLGLPQKMAQGTFEQYFAPIPLINKATQMTFWADAAAGNSGSPIVDPSSGLIVGILDRGTSNADEVDLCMEHPTSTVIEEGTDSVAIYEEWRSLLKADQ